MSESSLKATAEDDRCWDGNWMADGYYGMFIELDDDNFLVNQMEDYLDDQAQSGGKLKTEEEFIQLNVYSEDDVEGFFTKLQEEVLEPRNLHLADYILHRLVEGGCCPPRIRIQRIPDEEFQELMGGKRKGNQAFGQKKYKEAIEHYEDALVLCTHDLFVAPIELMEQVVNIMSNQAECHLRLKEYQEAGDAATNALLLNNNHEKSSMRRAKAEAAIGGISFLVQAQVDLEDLIDNQQSEAGVEEAKKFLEKVKELIKIEKKAFLQKTPKGDWDLVIQMYQSKCW